MRRKDRALSREEAYEVMDAVSYAVLAFSGEAYAVPISFVREGDSLYMHGAKIGTKMTRIEEDPRATMVFVEEPQVPDLYTDAELEDAIAEDSMRVFSRVFTTDFRSAIASGTIEVVRDDEECVHAMELLCRRYLPEKAKFARAAYASSKARTAVLKFTMKEITAKGKTTVKLPVE